MLVRILGFGTDVSRVAQLCRMNFPLYRKYTNGKSFFKIVSETRFEEIKLTGKQAELCVFEAKIFPDRQLIQDMIAMSGGFWLESTEAEFEGVERSLR